MRHKLFLIPGAGVVVLILGFLYFNSLNQSLVYYLTPTEAVERRADFEGRRLRLGGQVLEGSVDRTPAGVRFVVGDGLTEVEVSYAGAPPQLFREGAGAIVEGSWEGDRFLADAVIVKHDEEYRAPGAEEGSAARGALVGETEEGDRER